MCQEVTPRFVPRLTEAWGTRRLPGVTQGAEEEACFLSHCSLMMLIAPERGILVHIFHFPLSFWLSLGM